jgi:hypothetical protein
LGPVLTYETSYNEDQSPVAQAPDTPRKLRRVQNTAAREISGAIRLRQIFKKKEEDKPTRASPRRPNLPGGANRGRTPPGEGDGQEGAGAEGAEGSGAGEEAGAEGGSSGPSLSGIYNGFVSFANTFGDLRFSYRDDRSSRFSRVSDRPHILYQFGVRDLDRSLLVPVEGTGGAGLIEDNTSEAFTSTFDTSWQPSGSFYVDFAWSQSIAKTSVTGSRNKTFTTTFPDLSLNFEGLENRAFLKRFTRSSSLNSSYRRSVRQSGALPRLGEAPPPGERNWFDSETVSHDFAPLAAWRATWHNGINTTLTIDRSKNSDASEFRDAVSTTETTVSNVRLNGRYSFSAPRGVSFLGRRIRFSSDLTLNLDLNRGENKTVESTTQLTTGQITTATRSHTKNLGITPRATYNFSRKLQGSLDISYQRRQDLQRDRTDTTISVALEALIQF